MAQGRLSPPGLAQLVSLGADELDAEYTRGVQREYQARRDVLFEGLSRIPGVFLRKPEGAFYFVVRLPIEDGHDFAAWLLDSFSLDGTTVMVAPADGFYATPGLGRNEVRIAYVLNSHDLGDRGARAAQRDPRVPGGPARPTHPLPNPAPEPQPPRQQPPAGVRVRNVAPQARLRAARRHSRAARRRRHAARRLGAGRHCWRCWRRSAGSAWARSAISRLRVSACSPATSAARGRRSRPCTGPRRRSARRPAWRSWPPPRVTRGRPPDASRSRSSNRRRCSPTRSGAARSTSAERLAGLLRRSGHADRGALRGGACSPIAATSRGRGERLAASAVPLPVRGLGRRLQRALELRGAGSGTALLLDRNGEPVGSLADRRLAATGCGHRALPRPGARAREQPPAGAPRSRASRRCASRSTWS